MVLCTPNYTVQWHIPCFIVESSLTWHRNKVTKHKKYTTHNHTRNSSNCRFSTQHPLPLSLSPTFSHTNIRSHRSQSIPTKKTHPKYVLLLFRSILGKNMCAAQIHNFPSNRKSFVSNSLEITTFSKYPTQFLMVFETNENKRQYK